MEIEYMEGGMEIEYVCAESAECGQLFFCKLQKGKMGLLTYCTIFS